MLQQSPTCYVCPACGRAVDVLVPVGEAPRCARCDRLMKPPLRLALGGRGGKVTLAREAPAAPGHGGPAKVKPSERTAKPAPVDAPHQLGLFGGDN